ncbi:MAG: VTT domain-containing protein [Candidatus Komeilibacteria bacterium]
MEFFHWDLIALITSAGYIGILLSVFAESGLLIGIFLPGDSLLFAAGLLASQGVFNLWWLLLGCFLAAVAGDNVGYSFGHKVGPRIFTREDSWLFRREYITKTQNFYAKYGSKVIILARFIPVVRTVAPILAGVGSMRYRTFFIYNVIGGLLWSIALTVLGYFMGSVIPDIERYILPIIAIIIVVSVVPVLREIILARRKIQ